MARQEFLRVEVDGHRPTSDELRELALHDYGHFTAMQVRNGCVRGLARHLERLDTANREMFGFALDGDLVRDRIRHALAADVTDGSVRVTVRDMAGGPVMVVTVRPPGGVPDRPHTVRSVPYQRPLPHLKQVGGGFGQHYHHRRAARDGYTEVLLTGPGGVISEGGITNVAFFDGSAVIWPDAPALAGITMLLLESHLPKAGLASRRATVRLADVAGFRTMLATNARGITAVGHLDDTPLPIDTDFVDTVTRAYESVPWDRI